MPGGRPVRAARLVSNENDENVATTRMTRAKSAASGPDDLAPAKKALQTKRPTVSAATGAIGKRDVLGDVSNVGKVKAAVGKKAAVGLVSKAAQPTGVQKSQSRTASSRTTLAAKDSNKTAAPKRAGPGSLISKPKTAAPAVALKEEPIFEEENQPAHKKARTTKLPKIELEELKSEDEEEEKVEAAIDPRTGLPVGVENLDAEDFDDPLMVAEYATEIFEYLRDLECKSIPNPNYMDHQDELEWKTRGILVDWLIEVHTRFSLLPETLFLAINLVDRFLSEKVVQLDRLQLVGMAAMFIAAKYEEVMSPHVGNFRKISDDGFTEAEILEAEQFILSALHYDLSYPNPMNFLRRISKADNYDIQCRTIGKYLTEICLLDHRFLAFRPSHVAAGAMYLARLILDRGEWNATIAYYAGYNEDEVEPVVRLMIDYLARPVVHEAFFKKYAGKKFLKVSILTRQWAKKVAPHFGITDAHKTLDQISARDDYDDYE
ncbi:cyclin-like protein [Plectosphaerella plurivora]|uniref:Cyclin-like protein n=1 Tax=Plectosphaerella plurivora TaxID=936078 RepID=A0A9P8V9A2_9PEZI|nr:cyclin-like protein [Plectosphaerella plurivora]